MAAYGFGYFDSDVVTEAQFHLQHQDLFGYLCAVEDMQYQLAKLRLLDLMMLDAYSVLGLTYWEVARELR